MLIEENEKKRQAQLANTAPVVHAPPVVQPVVQQVQPQAGYAPQGAVVQPGYASPRAPGRLRAPAKSWGPIRPRRPSPDAPAATGTVVQAATSPRATSPRVLSTPQIHPRRPRQNGCLSKSHPALSRSPLALLK